MTGTLGEKLKRLRNEKESTLQDIREKTGINEGYLSKLERGIKTNPTVDVLEKLSNYFNVSVDYLLGRTNKKLPYDIEEEYNDLLLRIENADYSVSDLINLEEEGLKELFKHNYRSYKPSIEEAKVLLSKILSGRKHIKEKTDNDFEATRLAIEYIEDNFTNEEIKRLLDKIYSDDNLPSAADNKISKIPVLGYISAGQPLLAEEHIIDHEMIPVDQIKGGDYFYLKVRGDSMINAGIHNGDLVLVRQQPDIENNEIAVVMVNGYDATVKRVRKNKDCIKLIPENDNYEPVEINNSAAKIIGKVTALTRKF